MNIKIVEKTLRNLSGTLSTENLIILRNLQSYKFLVSYNKIREIQHNNRQAKPCLIETKSAKPLH